MRDYPAEYLVLPHTTDDGPVVGFINQRPIVERIRDKWGRCYVYCGVAPTLATGSLNLSLIRDGEWIVEPGLLYRLEDGTH